MGGSFEPPIIPPPQVEVSRGMRPSWPVTPSCSLGSIMDKLGSGHRMVRTYGSFVTVPIWCLTLYQTGDQTCEVLVK